MNEQLRFSRLDRTDRADRYSYTTYTDKDAQWGIRSLDMVEPGAHYSVTVKNYLRDDVYLVSSLRSDPQHIPSIYAHDRYMMDETTNFVIIEVRFQTVERDPKGGNRIISKKKVEIRCPGHLLENKSLFIQELGTYVTIGRRLDATRECIAQDSRNPQAKDISLPEALVKPDAVCTFKDYEPLVRNALERVDKIMVKVGVRVDVDPIRIPEHIKSMRIAVLDQFFSPYLSNRIVYDPSLAPHEFEITNLHFVISEPILSTYDRLKNAPGRGFFLDVEEMRTIHGDLCGMAIFADPEALQDYLITHQFNQVYDTLEERVIDKTANPLLKKRAEDLQQQLRSLEEVNSELEKRIKFEKEQTKDYKRIATAHEDTIKKLKSNHHEILQADYITNDLNNQRRKLDLEWEKLNAEKEEMVLKQQQFRQTHKASMFKNAADIVKSGWGILAIVATGVAALYKMWNKLKPT